MGFTLKGYVLEPPRIGQNNSPFTAGPNNFVPQTLLPVVGAPFAITNAQDDGDGLVQITTAAATGVMTGQLVFTFNVGGVPDANGTFLVTTVIDAHNFVLGRSVFSGSYTSGGSVLLTTTTPPTSCVFTVQTATNVVLTSSSMVGILNPGDTIVFGDQLGVTYTIQSVTASTLVIFGFYTADWINNTAPNPGPNPGQDMTSAYSPQHGTEVQAYNTAYPPSELNPRDDYLVLVTSELAPGSGTSYPVAPAGVQNYNGLVQININSPFIVSDGQTVIVSGVQGVPGANGTFTVSVLQTTPVPTMIVLNGSTFSGVYTGGGSVLVLQGSPGLLTTAGFGWTKNETVQRFDYDSHKGRFFPLPGGALTVAGVLSATGGNMQLKVPAPLEALSSAPFRLSIGTFGSGTTQTVVLVLADANFTPGGPHTPGTTELSLATGNLNWNTTDITVNFPGQQVQFQQQQYFTFGTSTGNIGTLSTAPSAPAILLNPIPGKGQFPLLRIGYLYWLQTVEVPNEGAFTPPPSGTVQWARDTGKLNFNAADVTANAGTSIYQDGTLFARDVLLPRVNLGPMPADGLLGPIHTPIPPTGDIIFTVPANPANNTQYYQWPYYQIIGMFDGGNDGTVEILQSTGQVQFTSGDAGSFQGQDVTVVFGDLPIDHGISIRLFRSYVNLSGQTLGVKDVTAVYSVQNAVWASPIMAQPLVFLPSTPVDDSTLVISVGQGTGTFTGGLNPVGGQNPIPGLGYTINFDTNQLNFAQRFQNIDIPIVVPAGFAQLPNTMVLTSNIELSFETGTGTGVFLPLTVGSDCLVDPMAGIVYFTTTFGVEVIQGSTGAFIGGTSFSDPTADFTGSTPPLPVQIGDYLLVLMDSHAGKSVGVYQITAVVNATTLSVDVAPPSGSGKLAYEILRGKEIMADRFFQTIILTDPTTSVERITSLGTIQDATTIVASGSATFPDQQTLSDSSSDLSGVQPGDTITLVSGPAAGQTFLVLQAAPNHHTGGTLTPTTSFTSVTACNYTVTRRLQIPVQYIGVVRFRFNIPTQAAPFGVFSTTVNVVATDADFSAPFTLSQGTVEVSQATGNLNFSQMDVTNGGPVFASRTLQLNVDYKINAGLGFIQFTTRLLQNEEVLLSYTQVPPSTTPPTLPAPPFTERGTFLVRKELTQPHPQPTNTLTFNPTGKTVATNPAPQVFRGGRPQRTSQVSINAAASTITFLPNPPFPPVVTDALPSGATVGPTENVYIDYYVFQAMGGEQTLTVLNPPILTASVGIVEGNSSFQIVGDQTGNFPAGFLMTVSGVSGLEIYQIGSSTYAAGRTTITLSGTQTFQSDETNPALQVASGPTPLVSTPLVPAYFTMELAPFLPIARGMNTFIVPGDKTGIYVTNTVLYVTDSSSSFTDFYLVTNSSYDSGLNQTTVTLTMNTLRQYKFGDQIVFRSIRPIFASAPTVVHTNRTPITIPTPQPMTVIRRVAGHVGQILSSPTGYTVDPSGNVTYVTPLQEEEEFSIFYTGHRVVGAGPRLLASYTATIVPDLATNGLLGQVLNANYTIFSPDNFFYRVETISVFKGQVAQEIAASAQSSSGGVGSGPMTSNTTSPVLYQQGQPSVWFPPGDYANHDLIAQAALLYFNNAVNDLEDVLHSIDGRIVGDVAGRFLFDGVIGRYNYFTYDPTLPSPPYAPTFPAFPLMANQIDDLVQILPGPVPPFPQSIGYFQQAYVTGPTSRFFQTNRNLFTTNPAVVSGSPNGGDIIATFDFSNIVQTPNSNVMQKRAPRAQMLFQANFNQSTFFVDDVVGNGTLRPSWLTQPAPASIIGMLVVIVDEQGNYYVDESDNYVVTAVTPPSGAVPGQISISGIPHQPVGPTGSPPSPSGGSTPTQNASVVAFDPITNLATIAGLAGLGPNQVGLQLNLSSAADGGNNGTFVIQTVISATACTVMNAAAMAPDPNNGSIGWILAPLNFVPAGSTITMSPFDTEIAQQLAQNVDSGAQGTYGQVYQLGKDVNVDNPTGNVLYQNPYWPFDGNSFFLLPQIFIPSSDYVVPVANGDILEMDGCQVAVTNIAPYEFPALTGASLDDDGNQSVPIVGPTFDGEMTESGGGPLYVEFTNEAVGSNFLTEITTLPYPATGNVVLAAGVAKQINLTSAIAFPGNVALLGTFSVTKGSPVVPTSVSQTAALMPGNVVQFASQPNSRYTVVTVVGGATPQITLSFPYTGTTAAPTTADVPLSGTFAVTRNSLSVTSSVSQLGVINQGDMLAFASAPTHPYGVQSNTTVSTTLSGNFTVSASITVTTSKSQVGVLNTGDTVQFGLQPGIQYTVATVSPTNITLTVAYGGSPGSTSGSKITSRILLTSSYLAPTNKATTGVKTLTGTFSVTHSSALVTTSLSQVGKLVAGDAISFASQPNVLPYFVAGTALAGTFHVTNGSPTVNTTANLTATLHADDTISFSSQPTVGYLVLTVTATTVTLTSNYTGTNAAAATGTKTSITSVTPFQLTLTHVYTGTTTASTTAMNISPGPANFNLVRVINSSAGNDSRWRPIASFTTTSVTVSDADAWSSIESGVHFAVAVSSAHVPNLGATCTLSGTTLTDSNSSSNGPFVGGPTAMLGNTYGVMTFLANSYNTTTLDTIAAVPPPTAQTGWGSFAPVNNVVYSAVNIGDIVTGTGIDPTQTVTVTQIGPGNSIQLSAPTTGGNQTGATFFLQFLQPPPLGTMPAGSTGNITALGTLLMGTTITGTQGAIINFDGTNVTFFDPAPSVPFSAGLIGQAIVISSGTAYSNNNGTFIISGFQSGANPTITFINTGAVAPDPTPAIVPPAPGAISWSIPPSPSIVDIQLPNLAGFQLGATVTDMTNPGYIPGGSVITQIGPGFQITLSMAPTPPSPSTDTILIQTTQPPTPWSTTVDSLTSNTVPPTQSNTDGFTQAMQIAPLVVSGNGILYNPQLIPPETTTIVAVGGSPPSDTDTSFVMSLPATTSTLTGFPLAFSNPTQTQSLLTIYVPQTVYPGWTAVLTGGGAGIAGARRQVVAITSTNTLQLDQAFSAPVGGGPYAYRLENTLDTYNGPIFTQIKQALDQEVLVISTRMRPPPRPYIWNLNSEQNALNDFFDTVFTTLIGPSTGTISNNPPGPAPFMILTDNSVNFFGPDPANPIVTTADFVYVTLGAATPINQGFLGTIATAVAGTAQFSDPTAAWSVADIGNFITISGAAVPANNGTFKIVTFTSANQVGINNANATSSGETNNGMLNWSEFTSDPVQEQDQGIYGIANVIGPHQLMVAPGFPAKGNVNYKIVSTFGISSTTLNNIFSLYEQNGTFLAQTAQFKATLTATVPVQNNGTVDANAYANGLNDVLNDMVNRYNQIVARLNFLSPTATTGAQAFIGAALTTSDNLYAKRFSWINARINLQSGYLILQNTASANIATNQANITNQLIQLLTIQGSG